MPQPKEGINEGLVDRVRKDLSRRTEAIDDRVPRERFRRVGEAATDAFKAVEQSYIRSLFRTETSQAQVPESPQE